MMLTVHDVAAYFLKLSGSGLDHMKLQKLCYLAQAYHLGLYGERLVDDRFRAFKWGPVSDALWRRHRYTQGLISPQPGAAELTEDERVLVESVFARYGCYSGLELSRITHRDQPFKEAWSRALSGASDEMDDKAIAALYEGKLTSLDTSEAAPLPDPDELQAFARGNNELREQSWAGYEEAQRKGV